MSNLWHGSRDDAEDSMPTDPILNRIVPTLATVPGVAAIALGGSRARGTATANSDYDIGLYFSAAEPIDTGRLLSAVRTFVQAPADAEVTAIGGWGPWIVGGGWLTVDGRKVDLLYRNLDDVAGVIEDCRAGEIAMHYQPGHPHGFCPAIWMGEVALCVPLHDPGSKLARLKAMTSPYPVALRDALIKRFQWEILFAIENAEIAIARGEQTHIAGCAYRALACLAQVLFALNERYLVNEKGALQEAAQFAQTIPDLIGRVEKIWQAIGDKQFEAASAALRSIEQQSKKLA
jgi:predicted nucleotidyltransferase